MKKLDFIVVGAQKSATTTLYQYLREHNSIALPLDKEAPFFNRDLCSEKKYGEFLYKHYITPGASKQQLWGKVSPQYMSGKGIARNIAALNPEVKIIAILRNPIKRAYSHYQMAVRRGTEHYSFNETMKNAMAPEVLEPARDAMAPMHAQGYESESDFYAAWGEYGRILEEYIKVFGKEQVLVLFTDDLKNNPEQSLTAVLEFLQLLNTWRPECLGKQFHQGGGMPLINPKLFKCIVKLPMLNKLYRLVPQQRKERLRYWIDQLNVRKNKISKYDASLSAEVAKQAAQLFMQDAMRLQSLDIMPPWLDDLQAATA